MLLYLLWLRRSPHVVPPIGELRLKEKSPQRHGYKITFLIKVVT